MPTTLTPKKCSLPVRLAFPRREADLVRSGGSDTVGELLGVWLAFTGPNKRPKTVLEDSKRIEQRLNLDPPIDRPAEHYVELID